MRAGRRVGEGRGICVSNSQCRVLIRVRRRPRRLSRHLAQTLSRASRCRRRSDAVASCALYARGAIVVILQTRLLPRRLR